MNFEDKGRVLAYLKNDDEKDRKKWEKLYLTDKPTDVRGGVFRDVKLKDKPNLHFQPIPDKNIERSITYITGASGSGASTVIATEAAFTFKDEGANTNSTIVTKAGLFDATCQTTDNDSGECTANETDMNMFAVQTIAVTVGEGDSLDVTWTITTGG